MVLSVLYRSDTKLVGSNDFSLFLILLVLSHIVSTSIIAIPYLSNGKNACGVVLVFNILILSYNTQSYRKNTMGLAEIIMKKSHNLLREGKSFFLQILNPYFILIKKICSKLCKLFS